MGIDVLIPVLGRPVNARKVATSLKNTHSAYNLVFICSPGDSAQIEASRRFGDVLVVDWAPGKGDFAKKINTAFRETDSEWVFQGADDISFGSNWDAHALRVAGDRFRVIGTNDLHNPAVKAGKHSTHTLFARSYVEERPATVDESDLVFWEGYDHQFCDMEFIEVAKRRNEWAFAKRAVVEHFHPHWGNAEGDPTYTKAMRSTNHDRRLYMTRMGIARPRHSERVLERQRRLKERRKV
jgi:hypothetical protein